MEKYIVKSLNKESLFPEIRLLQRVIEQEKDSANLSQHWLPDFPDETLRYAMLGDLLHIATTQGGLVGAAVGLSPMDNFFEEMTQEIIDTIESWTNDPYALYAQLMVMQGQSHHDIFKELMGDILIRAGRPGSNFSQVIVLERHNYPLQITLREFGFKRIGTLSFLWDKGERFPDTNIFSWSVP